MSDYIKVSGKTVEDALLEASIQLQTSSDNIEYNVIEKETKGFLGIGAKKAVIEARARRTDEDIVNEVNEVFSRRENEKKQNMADAVKGTRNFSAGRQNVKDESETKKADKAEKKSAAAASEKTFAGTAEKSTVSRKNPRKQPSLQEEQLTAGQKANVSLSAASDKKNSGTASKKAQETKPRIPADPEETKRTAEHFLTDLFSAMGTNVKITEEFENDVLSINLEGDDMGMLIGKRGQTLDSIQFLTSLVVNKGKSSYVRVKVDTENYRERRKQTLENLAKNIAIKVKRTGKPVYLEPMNPYERRIIHFALQNDPYVSTHSEGEDPCRKVVVTPKKKTEKTEE